MKVLPVSQRCPKRKTGQKSCKTRTYLKNRILVQDRGGAEFQTGGILLYVEDLKPDF
jgi:hypothetical protein